MLVFSSISTLQQFKWCLVLLGVMYSGNLPRLAGRNFFFRCFGISCFHCIILFCPDIFLVFLLSLTFLDLFSRVVLLVFLIVLLFLFIPTSSSILPCLIIFVLLQWFFSAFPVVFFIQVLGFCSCSLEEHTLSHKLILFLQRLACLIPWCFSLRYVLVSRFL